MAQNTAADEAQSGNYDVDDVIGKRIKQSSLIGLGVAVDHKVVRNGYGDERYVFVTTNEPESGTTYRDVDKIIEGLNSGKYELAEDPWADER
jgi:hypothetical protein